MLTLLGECPPLGSAMDITMREFMHIKRRRRLTFTKTVLQTLLHSADKADAESMKAAHKNYLNAELLIADVNENTDKALHEKYAAIRRLKPVAKVSRDGSVVVEGILSELESLL